MSGGVVIETMSGGNLYGSCWREMPQNIEEVFTAMVYRYFPSHWLSAANPALKPNLQTYRCIYYQLGDHFGEDPFTSTTGF